jgi:hypothetical protein
MPGSDVAAESRRNHQHRRGLVPIEHAGDRFVVHDLAIEIEVARIDEAGDHVAAGRAAIVVLDGDADIADVEVQCVAVDQQEERRDEQQDEERAPVAADSAAFPFARPPASSRSRSCRGPFGDVEEDVLE